MTTALVVDDSRVVRGFICKILEAIGFEVQQAENGVLAKEACEKSMPDVIIVDWNMPEMNGLEFVEALRAMPNGQEPKVVFCTTENDIKHIVKAIESGADEYIMKPFDRAILETKLHQVGILPYTADAPDLACAE